ncbi:MAG: efflux RND transporter periplasmic adaptor subunit, partial [Succinivibrionaceae bacterium]
MKSWRIVVPSGVILLFGAVIGFNIYKNHMIQEYLANMGEVASPVITEVVKPSNWQSSITAIGYISPKQGLDVSTEVSGRIISINFRSGDLVNKGDVLVKLNSAEEEANLKATKAQVIAAHREYERKIILLKKGSVSQKDLDDAKASYEALLGNSENIQAKIDKMTIRAPFNGVLGIKEVDLGQYIQPGTPIVHLEDTSDMKVRFTIAQNLIDKLHIGQDILVSASSHPSNTFIGSISALDSLVDQKSGVIEVEAIIPNSGNNLISGTYAKVQVLLPIIENSIIVPETAIQFNLYGQSVYVVKKITDK